MRVERRCGSEEWDTDVRYFYWTSAVWMHGRPFNPIRLIALPIHMGSLHPSSSMPPPRSIRFRRNHFACTPLECDRKQMDLDGLEFFYFKFRQNGEAIFSISSLENFSLSRSLPRSRTQNVDVTRPREFNFRSIHPSVILISDAVIGGVNFSPPWRRWRRASCRELAVEVKFLALLPAFNVERGWKKRKKRREHWMVLRYMAAYQRLRYSAPHAISGLSTSTRIRHTVLRSNSKSTFITSRSRSFLLDNKWLCHLYHSLLLFDYSKIKKNNVAKEVDSSFLQ